MDMAHSARITRRSIHLCLFVTAVLTVGVVNGASAKKLLYDFGADTQPTGGNYNNVTNVSFDILNSIDAFGNPTGISLTQSVVDTFNPGANESGPNPAAPPADLFDSQATRDNLFGNSAEWQGGVFPVAKMTLAGLDTTKQYDFTFFAGRLGVSDNRETQYDVNGTTIQQALLNAANNTSKIAQVTGVTPHDSGTIQLIVQPGPNNDNEFGFFYLGAMRIDEVDPGAGSLELTVDRATGAMTLGNPEAGVAEFTSYSITSDVGAVDPNAWKSITGNYDSNGDGSVAGGPWTRVSDPASRSELAEGEVTAAGNAALAPGQSISLDLNGGLWIANPVDDLLFSYERPDGTFEVGTVRYVGASIPSGDMDFDGDIDSDDWAIYKPNLGEDLFGLSQAEAYQRGDLNADGLNDVNDFTLFKIAFDGANGIGAFDAMIAAVPEPASVVLLVLGGVVLLGGVRKRPSAMNQIGVRWKSAGRRFVAGLVLASSLASGTQARTLLQLGDGDRCWRDRRSVVRAFTGGSYN